MDIQIAVRHFEPPVEFKMGLEKRLSLLVEKHSLRALDAGAVVSLENSRYRAELDIRIKGISFHSHEEDHDLHQCVEKVFKKMDTQVRRYKDKKVSLKKRANAPGGRVDENS